MIRRALLSIALLAGLACAEDYSVLMSPTFPDAAATATELSQSTWPVLTNQSSASLGAEKLSATWGLGTGWSGTFATGFTHTTGNTATLTEATTYTSGGLYTVAWTVTGRTAGASTLTGSTYAWFGNTTYGQSRGFFVGSGGNVSIDGGTVNIQAEDSSVVYITKPMTTFSNAVALSNTLTVSGLITANGGISFGTITLTASRQWQASDNVMLIDLGTSFVLNLSTMTTGQYALLMGSGYINNGSSGAYYLRGVPQSSQQRLYGMAYVLCRSNGIYIA